MFFYALFTGHGFCGILIQPETTHKSEFILKIIHLYEKGV